MIVHKISVPEKCSNNCYDGIIYSVLKYYGHEYEFYNINYLYFNYFIINNDKIIFKKENKHRSHILRKFYDINIEFIEKKEENKLFEVVQQEIKNSPIGIFIDPFVCNWSPFFNKVHSIHILLIVGYDSKNYICLDMSSKQKQYIKIKYDLLNLHFIKYFTFKLGDKETIDNNKLFHELEKRTNEFNQDINFQKDLLFHELRNIKNYEITGKDLQVSPILIGLSEIAEDRGNFIIFLKRLEERFQIVFLDEICNLFELSKKFFLILKALLTKYLMTGLINEAYLRNTVNDIFDADKKIVENLKKILELEK